MAEDVIDKTEGEVTLPGVVVPGAESERATEAHLSEVKNGLIRIAVAYTGTFEKVEDGVLKKFKITPKDLQQMRQRLSERETPIDYDHLSAKTVPPGWSKAAGWFAAKLGDIEDFGKDRQILYAWAEFTPACLSMVSQKEYRYFSPEPHWNDTNEQGKNIGTRIAAGAITNRPFLKDLPPIEIKASDYTELLQMVAMSESKRMLTMDPSSAHADVPVIQPEKESKTMTPKKFKLKKLADGENKGQTGCFDETGEMVGLAEKEGGKGKLTFRLNKDGEHAGKVGVFDGEEMAGLADHRSLKTAMRQLTEYDPSEAEDDPDEATKKIEARKLAEQEHSNAVCLTEIANAKPGEVIRLQERFVQEGKLSLPGYMKAQGITRLVEEGIKSGKILPRQRTTFFIFATADFKAAEQFLTDMLRPAVDTRTVGIQGSGEVLDPKKEIEARITALMTENKSMTYSNAVLEVSKADSYLWGEYEKQKSKEAAATAR